MGGSSGKAAETAQSQMALSSNMYDLSSSALKGGSSYLTGAYGMGGMNQDAKYGAMQSQAMEQSAGFQGSFLNPASMGTAGAMRAQAVAGVGSQKILSGMDEMNKLRSQMAGQGLATTNFAQQAGAQSSQALRGMADNPTMSTISAGLGLGAAAYGGFKGGGANPFAGNVMNQGLKPGGVWGGGFTTNGLTGGISPQPGSTGMVGWGE